MSPFPAAGEPYTAVYLGGPLDGQSEERESVGRLLTEIASDGEPEGQYVLSDHQGNGAGSRWTYVWLDA